MSDLTHRRRADALRLDLLFLLENLAIDLTTATKQAEEDLDWTTGVVRGRQVTPEDLPRLAAFVERVATLPRRCVIKEAPRSRSSSAIEHILDYGCFLGMLGLPLGAAYLLGAGISRIRCFGECAPAVQARIPEMLHLGAAFSLVGLVSLALITWAVGCESSEPKPRTRATSPDTMEDEVEGRRLPGTLLRGVLRITVGLFAFFGYPLAVVLLSAAVFEAGWFWSPSGASGRGGATILLSIAAVVALLAVVSFKLLPVDEDRDGPDAASQD